MDSRRINQAYVTFQCPLLLLSNNTAINMLHDASFNTSLLNAWPLSGKESLISCDSFTTAKQVLKYTLDH
ncbi:uncharacterized protein TrAtP1_000492 [Trichoderma atroviride]|uniref:uncharacterized protein n=1 Tax=Hypocrea atroviridis TaxID=63577 RepID=UPI003316C75A|nr:hypothetical protein TrAtP1_000492 [Trichoderma atroviride]